MRQKEINEKMVECIRKMYDGAKFGVKCGDNEVTVLKITQNVLDMATV
jgi:hypothetical protein